MKHKKQPRTRAVFLYLTITAESSKIVKLTQKQFEVLLQKGQLVLSLIGMSSIGKTYWSEKLTEFGFKHCNCDDLIEKQLGPELKAHRYSGIADVSRWMGQPYNKRFSENQQKYLKFEKGIMKNIFTKLMNTEKHNIVIDATGSIVHCGNSICRELKKHTLVVYIEATDSMKEDMFKLYIKDPKPVVFGNIFDRKKDETNRQALKRCYKKLLDLRSKLYSKYADVVIPREIIIKNMNVNQFISLIKKLLA